MEGFKPVLVVVDYQEDFCPPHGSLAVEGGRDIAPAINGLLDLPFVLKVATQDWHPRDHVSFASNHPPPDNRPFESTVLVQNPLNNEEAEKVRLWPDHCVIDSFGANFVPEFHISKLDLIVQKGQDSRVEMFSAFRDTYTKPRVSESTLGSSLTAAGATHVYVVGLALDFCVKWTAIHAAEEGYQTYIISEAAKPVSSDHSSLQKLEEELTSKGVRLISLESSELARVRSFQGD